LVLPVKAGEPMPLAVEIFPTDAVIKKGHRLRLAVGPSDFPHAAPPLPQEANLAGGQVSLLHDAQHPSYLELPTLGSCSPVQKAKAKAKKKKARKKSRTKKKKNGKNKRRTRRSAAPPSCARLPVPDMTRGGSTE
jgi:hypothetical protein